MTRRILLSGGGTAGSVTPLLALGVQLKRLHADTELLFVGTTDGPERALAEAAGIPFRTISAGKLRRYVSWQNIRDIGRILSGYHQAVALIKAWKPDTVVSAGSYASVPLVLAAKRYRCKVLVHQQDVRPGLANRVMAKFADLVTVSYEVTKKFFPADRVRLVGNPVRPEVLSGSAAEAAQIFHLEPAVPVLLVIGGGTGAAALNHLLGITAFKLVADCQIIHLTGHNRDSVELQDERYQQYEFLTWQLPHALAAATLVVSRAGLGLITELSALGKPAIIIPMPDTHQEDNARLLQQRQAAVVLPQKHTTAEIFVTTVQKLLHDEPQRQSMSHNIHQLYRPNALLTMTDLVLHLTDV